MSNLIGIDIGGTKCAVILGEYTEQEEINIIDKVSFSTEVQKEPQYALNKINDSIEGILEKNSRKPDSIYGIGISCGGPLNSKRGTIMSPPNLIGWDNIPITDIMEKRFGIRTRIQNDANACALAEWKFGAAKGYTNVIFLTFGTGMGAGLILDGKIYSGTNDMAGEVGHIRLADNGPVGYGKAGSFEGFCSGGGIAQLARTMVLEKLQKGEKVAFCDSIDKLGEINAKVVGDAAEAGDELAKEIYRICGCYLGRGLSILIDVLNPEIIVLGSIFTRSRDLLYDTAMEIIRKEA
ncbi:MAG: ROK family protein, partial [Clostridiales bacterium]|nr:ROK family protein [Clostridiales bacterium]